MQDLEDLTPAAQRAPELAAGCLSGVSFHIITMGCAHNQADSDAVASHFLGAGGTLAALEEADVVYVNSCTVKTPSEQKALNEAERALKRGQRVVLGGCVPQSARVGGRLSGYLASGQLLVGGVLDDGMLDVLVGACGRPAGPVEAVARRPAHNLLRAPAYRHNPLVEIVPASHGCLGACTYCKTVQSRGRLASHPVEQVVARVRAAAADPLVREIWLTGEDALGWGRERGEPLGALLRAVVAALEEAGGPAMLRLGMGDPESALGREDELVEALSSPRVFKFLHLPVQSASDRVLSAMGRRYRYADYARLVAELVRRVPGLVVATDVIVGFPGETEDDFAATMQYLATTKPEIVNVTQYYPRPGTLAAKWPQVPAATKKQRSRDAAAAAAAAFDRRKYVGCRYRVALTELLPYRGDCFPRDRVFGAKSPGYLSVLVQFDGLGSGPRDDLIRRTGCALGDIVAVRIIDATRVALVAVLDQ